jgi:hypothetical protein
MLTGIGIPFNPPGFTVRHVVKHFVNPASRGGFPAIEALPPVPVGEGIAPVVVDGLGRLEGLYNVCHPALEYTIPCVFKSTGWVRQRLTAREWLMLQDIPMDMCSALEDDAGARSSIALALLPLLVCFLFRTFWGTIRGGEMRVETTASTPRVDQERVKEDIEDTARITDDGPEVLEEDRELHAIIRAQHDLAKAVKADDAVVPVYLWNDRIFGRQTSEEEADVLSVLRQFTMRVYRRRLLRECIAFLHRTHGGTWLTIDEKGRCRVRPPRTMVDIKAMREIIWRASYNEWFEYPYGSRLHYFRFPRKYRSLARDGVLNYFIQPGPTQRLPQPPPLVEAAGVLIKKLSKMIQRQYLAQPEMKLQSLIKFFAVPKGEGDWRIVYHAGANGLNDCVWAPPFYLPTVDALLRIVDHSSFMEDRDIGEMFLNFELHPNTRRFVGVDVRPLGLDKVAAPSAWLGWTKNLMGFKSSPYNSVKMYLICEEIIRGD